MGIKCLMNGLEVNYPCSPACALFGDCVTAFEANKKASVRTNADRIRAMTDEELADKLANLVRTFDLPDEVRDIWMSSNKISVRKAFYIWLQQPAGGAGHG